MFTQDLEPAGHSGSQLSGSAQEREGQTESGPRYVGCAPTDRGCLRDECVSGGVCVPPAWTQFSCCPLSPGLRRETSQGPGHPLHFASPVLPPLLQTCKPRGGDSRAPFLAVAQAIPPPGLPCRTSTPGHGLSPSRLVSPNLVWQTPPGPCCPCTYTGMALSLSSCGTVPPP